MSETKWKKSNKTTESFTDANQMEIKIQRIRGKKKGFSKLPVLDNIYEPEIAPEPEIVPTPEELEDPEIVSKFIPGPDPEPIVEGMRAMNKKLQQARAAQAAKVAPAAQAAKKAQLVDISSPPVATLPSTIDIKQQVQSGKDKFRDFVKKYGQYLDIFYVIDLGLDATRKEVEKSIYYIIGIENATTGFLEFSKAYAPVLMKDILNEKTDTLIEDLWSNADADLKKKYEDAAKKLNEKRDLLVKNARNDSNVIIDVLRFYIMTIIGVLMSYNVLYTWITSRGKTEDSSEPASATAEAAKGVFKIFRVIYEIPITAMKFLKFGLKTQGDLIKNALSPTYIYLITIAFFTTFGMVDLAQRISRGMTASLTAISNGKYEKNVWMYAFIVFFWIIDAIWTVVESPFTWIGLIAGTVLFITYLIIILANTMVFASVFNILISFYVVYRLILLIPIRRDFQTYAAFGEVNSAAKPPDDEELNSHRYKPLNNWMSLRKYVLTATFLFENFFSFIFIIVSLLSTIILGKNLKFKSLKTTLPIVMMAMIMAFIKYKYEALFNPESKPAAAAASASASAVWEGVPLDSKIELKEKIV